MFDYIWSRKDIKNNYELQCPNDSIIIPSVWSEHCVECSAPACYKTCSIYRKRMDGECVRIHGGITPVGYSKNKLMSGAQLHFNRWAKIECLYDARGIESKSAFQIYKFLNFMGIVLSRIAERLPGSEKKWVLTRGVYSIRQKQIRLLLNRKGKLCNDIALKILAKAPNDTKYIVEIKNFEELLYRNSVTIGTKLQEVCIHLPVIEGEDYKFLCIYPENYDQENDLYIEYMELVEPVPEPTNHTNDSDKKVKCVVWDLDNTLWEGTLIESSAVKIRNDIVNLIYSLDEKGIVNSICSKNDYESAMKKLETFGLKNVFVFPKINWDPKSVNIQQIIQQMNISADTIVFVDDTAFEREEVKSAIKDITVVDQNEILEYVSLSRFEVPVTEDSKNRRNTYHMMEKQQEEQKAWKGNIDEFLRNCKMQLTIGKPFEDEIQRCYELLQRTNQLNASGRRLELEQVKKYWLSDTFDTSVLVCEDKFGSYGLVGFSIIEKKEIPIIIDFVISCRVANKKVEHSFIKNLAKKSNSGRIRIRYKKTDRNGPIFKVVTDLDMKLVNTEEGFEVYEYLLNSNDISDVVSVVERKWENEN